MKPSSFEDDIEFEKNLENFIGHLKHDEMLQSFNKNCEGGFENACPAGATRSGQRLGNHLYHRHGITETNTGHWLTIFIILFRRKANEYIIHSNFPTFSTYSNYQRSETTQQ